MVVWLTKDGSVRRFFLVAIKPHKDNMLFTYIATQPYVWKKSKEMALVPIMRIALGFL